jgi:hypothetical protein
MSSANAKIPTQERERRVMSGWVMLPITLLLYIAGPVLIALAFVNGTTTSSNAAQPVWAVFIAGIVAILVAVLLSPGFFTLQPNEARVLILFGDYRGTAKQGGFCWGNPFYSNGPATQSTGQSIWTQAKNKSGDDSSQAQPKKLKRYKISLRARTLNGEKLKVNDKRGNPVDIAAVVVWRVEDTAKAVFDVDDFETYVATQSETAVRHLASAYPYDSGETFADTDDEITRQRRRGVRGLARGTHRATRAGGRDRGAGPPHPSCLRPRDRPGDASPAAGRGGHRRAPQDRHRRREHGGDGPPRLQREQGRGVRQRTQSRHGEQPDGRAVRREPGHAGRQHGHAVHVRPAAEGR